MFHPIAQASLRGAAADSQWRRMTRATMPNLPDFVGNFSRIAAAPAPRGRHAPAVTFL